MGEEEGKAGEAKQSKAKQKKKNRRTEFVQDADQGGNRGLRPQRAQAFRIQNQSHLPTSRRDQLRSKTPFEVVRAAAMVSPKM